MTTKRCRSNCTTNKSIASCNSADKCSYTNGPKRKFCRLSTKYKMVKPDCTITRKFLKREKESANKIRKFIERHHATRKAKKTTPPHPVSIPLSMFSAKNPTAEEIAKFTNKVQSRRLARFMKAVDPNKRRARYLNGVCSDSGVCIAFSKKDRNTIMKHFDGFTRFDHVKSLRKIGAVSANGFVKELEYENTGYKSHAVLKSSTKADTDNLYYEYLVGMTLNMFDNLIPLFVETYGAFQYTTDADYEEMKKLNAKVDALKGIKLVSGSEALQIRESEKDKENTELLKESCKNSKYMCVLIQHLKDATTLQEKCHDPTFVKVDLVFSLYQIYYVLSNISDMFVHNDLHSENVLLYEPVKDSYIHYFYHQEDGSVVSFYSHYITKIIDYGRCFFDRPRDHDKSPIGKSSNLLKALCSISECMPSCGYDNGYYNINPVSRAKAYEANVSNDLRLLWMLYYGNIDFPGSPGIGKMCRTILKENYQLTKLLMDVKYTGKFFTANEPVGKYPAKIVNVDDANRALHDFVTSSAVKEANANHYQGKKCLGELHIYGSQEMEFIPAV